ncbi:hypothetical protein WJX73_005701 [Symbiochloris irregularis]|uniref:ABC transporter domain-containing protein n=1 Tax=Symbiochloris irregularis TaxID=706552 RepID=A0AAW1P6R7_9CHLO
MATSQEYRPDEDPIAEREDSGRSSRISGEFMRSDPKFDSPPGSSDSDSELGNLAPQAPLVTLVWRQLTVTTKPNGLFSKRREILKYVSGYVEPRGVVAVVGPRHSGKSALVMALAGQLSRPAQASGEVLINGLNFHESKLQPTYFSAWDAPLVALTVEQVLIYTALLKWQDQPMQAIEEEVRKVCQMLGLLGDLGSTTHKLPIGLQRRVTVACQLIGASPLLLMHDALEGLHEGDALAIMRAVHEYAKHGSSVMVSVQQPTTDMCSFFTRAIVLCAGEVVYFGETGAQAVQLLGSAGMPCPPLYSPLEQFMRLIDPTFEVYLQVAQAGNTPDWNSRFSGMMFKVLQDTYHSSGLAKEAAIRTGHLASMSPDRSGYKPRPLPAWRQVFVLMRRLVAQGLRCFPLYLSRILLGVVIALIYGGTYSQLNFSFQGAMARLSVFSIVVGFLPMLALTSMPVYHNSVRVYERERQSCDLGLFTHSFSLFLITLPHVLVSAVLTAVIFVPWSDLNQSGDGWGFFIFDEFLVMMCADALVLAIAAIFNSALVQLTVAVTLFLVQLLAMGIFPGTNKGIQLVFNTIGFPGWGYRGMLLNEFTPTSGPWGCPGAIQTSPNVLSETLIIGKDLPSQQCSIPGDLMKELMIKVNAGRADWGGPKWYAAYIVIGIFILWELVFLAAMLVRVKFLRSPRLRPPMQRQPTVTLSNPASPMNNNNNHQQQQHNHHHVHENGNGMNGTNPMHAMNGNGMNGNGHGMNGGDMNGNGMNGNGMDGGNGYHGAAPHRASDSDLLPRPVTATHVNGREAHPGAEDTMY